jgi:hypothetical protein
MKKIILLLILLPILATSQQLDTFSDISYASYYKHTFDSLAPDTAINKICAERGHVSGGLFMVTGMYCTPYLIETDSTTIIVYPACNYETFICLRCGKKVTRLEKERRVVIWSKK